MLQKNQENGDLFNLVDEKSKQLQGETREDSLKKSLTTAGIILAIFIVFFCLHNVLCLLDKKYSKPKLLAWSSEENNKIRIVELETRQEIANSDRVKLNKTDDGILQLFISNPTLRFQLDSRERDC